MITPQDLRIGNLVKYNGEFYAIRSFDEEHVVLKDNVLAEYYLDYIGYDEIEAVEITEEWLLKLGFETLEKEAGFEFLSKYKIVCFTLLSGIAADRNVFLVWKNDSVICDVKYLHQLQNLHFALTIKELEINL